MNKTSEDYIKNIYDNKTDDYKKKMTLYNFTSNSYFNTIYKPFNTEKYSL